MKAGYWEQVVEREISESLLTGASNLRGLQYTLSHRLSDGTISNGQLREWLLRYCNDCKADCDIRYDAQADAYFEVSWNRSYKQADKEGRPLAVLGVTRIRGIEEYERMAEGSSVPHEKTITFAGNPDTLRLELLPGDDGGLLLCGYTDSQLFVKRLDAVSLAIADISLEGVEQVAELRYENHEMYNYYNKTALYFDGDLAWQRQEDTLVLYLDNARLCEMKWVDGKVLFAI